MAAEKTAELTDKLNRFLDQMIDGLQKGGEFVAEQSPLVVQELIAYKRAEHTLTALILLAFLVFWTTRVRKKLAAGLAKMDQWDREPATVFGYLGWGAVLAGVIPWFAVQTHYAIEVWIAPRVYLIECIADLIRRK